jgi:CheY-like chemotaxis protein
MFGQPNGRKGIEKAQHLKPALIVLDLAMPSDERP